MRSVKHAGKRETEAQSVSFNREKVKGDLIIVCKYLTRGRDFTSQRYEGRTWFCGWMLKLDKFR